VLHSLVVQEATQEILGDKVTCQIMQLGNMDKVLVLATVDLVDKVDPEVLAVVVVVTVDP
tara:strand:+ start:91 stop:270 length:180 start_codon:yes stop_codon:yes gene_type:complete